MLVFLRKTKEKHPNSQKWAKFHELFVLALSLVWFAGATPDSLGAPPLSIFDGPYPQYGWDFPEEIPGKFWEPPPETLSELFLDFPSRVLSAPK